MDDSEPIDSVVIPAEIPTNNYYQPLENTPGEENTKPKNKKPPPIVLPSEGIRFKALIEGLKRIIKEEEFQVQYLRKNIKIFVNNTEQYDKVKENLKQNNAPFYTYTKREERVKKMVLKGPPNMEIEAILEELNNAKLEPKEVVKLKSATSKMSHSYLVTIPNSIQTTQLKELKSIDHAIIKWEHYAKRNSYTQCHRCQFFGHGSRNCNMPARCVKCAGKHETRTCTMQKTETSKPKCCNCSGDHTANYSKCPALLEYMEKSRQNNNNKQQQQTKTTRTFQSKPTNPGISYAKAMKPEENKGDMENKGKSGLEELNNVLKEIEEKHHLSELINKAINLGKMLDKCSSEEQKIMIVHKFLNP